MSLKLYTFHSYLKIIYCDIEMASNFIELRRVLSIRVASFTFLLQPVLADSNTSSTCTLFEQSLKAEYITQVEKQCNNEYRACLNELNSNKSTNTTNKIDKTLCLERPLTENSEYVGRCPKTLLTSEQSTKRDTNSLFSKFQLRVNFLAADGEKFYKSDDSKADMYSILSKDPNDYSAIFNLVLFAMELNLPPDEHLQFWFKLSDLEPDCHQTWYHQAFMISLLSQELQSELIHANVETELKREALNKLIRRGILYFNDIYRKLFAYYDPVRKLYVAWEYVNYRLISDRDEETEEQVSAKRKEFIIDAMKQEFSVDGKHDRETILFTMCNDYAFDIGLVDECLASLNYYWSSDLLYENEVKGDALAAARNLVLSTSRPCSEYVIMGTRFHYMPIELCFRSHIPKVISLLNELKKQVPAGVIDANLLIYTSYVHQTDAFKLYQQAVKLEPRNVAHALLLAKGLFDRNERASAIQVVDIAIRVAELHDLDSWLFNEDGDRRLEWSLYPAVLRQHKLENKDKNQTLLALQAFREEIHIDNPETPLYPETYFHLSHTTVNWP